MGFRTKPSDTPNFPSGIPYIIGNEAAERFSFYGMKAALVVFMTSYLHLMGDQVTDKMSPIQANANHHWFVTGVYLTPLLGAFISDRFFGKYTTIIWLSLVYCLGHFALACMGVAGPAVWWFIAGLGLIAVGGGGIKPCVSAHVGDQFGPNNQHLLSKIFNWFYFSINLGAAVSNLLIPWVLVWYGPHWAFGLPGALMVIATIVFWMGRHAYVHIPAGGRTFTKDLFSKEGRRTILRLCSIFLFIPIFWTLFDQTSSSWIFQAIDMDREIFGIHMLPSQVQAANPFLILLLIPLFSYGIYPLVEKVVRLTPLRKIGVGLFLTAMAFALSAVIQGWIDAGSRPSIGWQLLCYVILTSGEIMVSIVCLEFAYTQAPKHMKSVVMALFLASVAFGNSIAALINMGIQAPSPLRREAADAQKSMAMGEAVESQYKKSLFSLTYAGFDGVLNTDDDIRTHFDDNGVVAKREIPSEDVFFSAAQIIEEFYLEADKFPQTDDGQKLISGWTDAWGSPLVYRLLNGDSFRISSVGPDKKSISKWDLGVVVSAPEQPETEASPSRMTWVEQRQLVLGLKSEHSGEELSDSDFKKTYFVGGLSRLEGASYFWFFTGLMMVTTLLFIPVSLSYKPTNL